MNIRICIIVCFTAIVTLPCFELSAQEYKYEIGGMAGTSSYMGDANKTALFREPKPAGGVIFRYNKNFRLAYKASLAFGGVSGTTLKSGNAFPNGAQASFSRTFIELGGQVEFNFFSYSDKYAYLGTRKISPYMFTGLGITAATGDNFFTGLNIPLGIGVKYKLKDRLNLGFEFSFRKLFGDSFDQPEKERFGLNDPYNISSSSLKNKDWYSLTVFSITWDFGMRKDPCLNDAL
ncbi:type IX secretion system protein PorG [Viscerimonas tarda]